MAWNEPGPNRDPWSQGPGGKKSGDGPPDLDEMLKRLKARFGGGPKGPGSRGPGAGGALPKGLIALGGVVLVVFWVFSGFYIVDEQERAVVLRFGAFDRSSEPGWGWRFPWPIERHEIVNVTQIRQVEDSQSMLTKDENIVAVQLTVQYRISSAEDYLFNVEDPDTTLQQATKSAVRETVGRSTMDFILTEGRLDIANSTELQLQEILDQYETGLVVTEVNLQQAQPPEAVQSAFADAIKAREDQERLKNEAEAYANERLPRARGAASRQVQEATGYRDQVVARAEGDAARFTQLVTEYRLAPDITRERLYLDTMRSVLGSSSKVLIDVEGGDPVFYLPLDQLQKRVGSTVEADNYVTQPGISGQSVSPGPADSSRTRERAR